MKFNDFVPDLSLPHSRLIKIFQKEHERFSELYPGWSLLATRRKLVAAYWLHILEKHFSIILSAGILITLLINFFHPAENNLTPLLPAGVIVFLALFFMMYWPAYHLEFLPQLDSCMDSYNSNKPDSIPKCKKQQYHVLTVMLIQYCYQQMAGIKTGSINTHSTKLLMKLYGVSQRGIDTSLRIIILGQWDRNQERLRTEITNDFEQAKDYFNEQSCHEAIAILNRLHQKVLNSSTK